jgi:hypothetical protein
MIFGATNNGKHPRASPFRKNLGKTASIYDLSAASRCALVLFVLFLENGDTLNVVMSK